jgi:hypothetical protein
MRAAVNANLGNAGRSREDWGSCGKRRQGEEQRDGRSNGKSNGKSNGSSNGRRDGKDQQGKIEEVMEEERRGMRSYNTI